MGIKLLSKYPIKIKTFGHSMFPLLHDEDVVFIRKIPFSKLKTNDIICVKKNGQIFTHRVIYKKSFSTNKQSFSTNKAENYLITKGDNNQKSDGKIYQKNIVGIVYQIKRGNSLIDPENIYLIQSTHYFKQILKVKKAFEKENISFVILKGLPLHLYFENLHPRRLYADCDVLIEKKHTRKANNVLKKLNYKIENTSLQKGQKPELSYTKVVNGFGVSFDIHLEPVFMMTQTNNLNELYDNKLLQKLTEKFLGEKRLVLINGQNFPILSKPDLLVYLMLHLYHHNFKEAYRFEFIKKLIEKEKPNWPEIAKTIKEFQLENFTYAGFVLLKKYYNLPIPGSFLKSTEPVKPALEFINKNILMASIFDSEGRLTSGIGRFKNLFVLSPQKTTRKIFVFLNKEVLFLIFWTLSKKFNLKSR